MHHLNRALRVLFCLMLIQLVFSSRVSSGLAQEKDGTAEALSLQEQEETKAKIAQKKETLAENAEEAEKALAEKEVVADEVRQKEQEAAFVQKEAALLKEEAGKTRDAVLGKKAVEAERQARQLADEAAQAGEKLKLAESRARLTQEKIARDQAEIEHLKNELYHMKLEAAGLGGFTKWINQPLFYISGSPVTFGGIGGAFFIILAALFISGIIQKIIIGKLSKTSRLKSGAVYAIGRVAHYAIVIFAVVLAAQCVGLNLGSLAVVFGFLSVGVGFGLQNITSNFISGLILLFERPIAVGDFVTVDEQRGTVKQINMRSSLIETLDNVRIIVPNSKFIEGNVTNWSHGSTHVRLHCPVGVAYGSDVPKVKEILLKVAEENRDVLRTPPPAVRFLGFGDSSLDFELLIWVNEPEQQYVIHSDINYAIDAAFRKGGVQIPFPQRDLHLKSSNVLLGGGEGRP